MKSCPKIQGKYFFRYLSKMWYLWTKNMKGVTVKVENLHRGKSYPALKRLQSNFMTVAPYMEQISPKYFHSLKPRNHIFEAHPYLKISIDSLAAVASFQIVPKYISKVKEFPNILLCNNCFLEKWGQRGQFVHCNCLIGIDL